MKQKASNALGTVLGFIIATSLHFLVLEALVCIHVIAISWRDGLVIACLIVVLLNLTIQGTERRIYEKQTGLR